MFLTSFALSAQKTQCPRNETNCRGQCGLFTDEDRDGFCDLGNKTEENTLQNVPPESSQNEEKPAKPYHILPVSIVFVALYLISLMLIKIKVYRKSTHRKIWNIALTITFLISSCLGVILAIFINHQTLPDNYLHLLKYHVDFGIAMTMIVLFHISWHFNYFKTVFIKKKT
jgi:hypothetical protein